MSGTTEYAGVGTASLSASVSAVDGDEPYPIHGIALGSGDITLGQSGIRKYWPAATLKEAVDSLEGKPLVKDHINNSDGHVGTVTKAWFDPGVGVRYEAEIAPHYEQLARDVAAGIKDVSPRIKHPPESVLENYDDATLEVHNARFSNLSIVNDGASPSNTANFGAADSFSPDHAVAMSAFEDGEMATATLERGYDPEMLAKDVSDGNMVQWETDSSSGYGEVTDVSGSMLTIDVYEEGDDGWASSGEEETLPMGAVEMWLPSESDMAEMGASNTLHPTTGGRIGHYGDSVRSIDEPANVSESPVELSDNAHLQALSELADDPMVSRPEGGERRATFFTPLPEDATEDGVMEAVSIAEDELGKDISVSVGDEGVFVEPIPDTGVGITEFMHPHLDIIESAFDNTTDIRQKSTTFIGGDAEGHSIQPCFMMDDRLPDSALDEISRLYEFVAGVTTNAYYNENRLYLDTRQNELAHANLDVAEILVRRTADDADIGIQSHSFKILEETAAELGRSNVEQYDVEADQWVQWYPSETTEKHGYATSVSDDEVTIEVWTQLSDGTWKTNGDTVTKSMDDVEGWGNYPSDDAIITEMMMRPTSYGEGDIVEWESSPYKVGRVVHIDEENHVVMVEVHKRMDGELVTTGYTDTASYTDVRPVETDEKMASDDRKAEGDGRSGSDTNDSGSADSSPADIDFSDQVTTGLENKVEKHNDKHDADSKRVTLRKLKAVYRRGAGAYSSSHRKGMSRNQWSMARVNAFLYLVRNGNPENDAYTQDNDLLPDGHPRATSESSENAVSEGDGAVALLGPYDQSWTDTSESLMVDGDELDSVYADWNDAVTMSASELRRWAANPCSKEASLDPKAVLERNLSLLETNKTDWTDEHLADAKRTISFISRMSASENEPESPMDGVHGCPSRWGISLLNWAHNPFPMIPDKPEDGDLADKPGYENLAVSYSDTPSGKSDEETVSRMESDQYATKEAAQNRADDLGCDGFHEHESGGETIYMPCGSMQAYQSAASDSYAAITKVADDGATTPCCGAEELASTVEQDSLSVTFEGTKMGDLDETALPSEGFEPHYIFPSDIKSDSSYPVVDADGQLRRGNVDAAWQLRGQGDYDVSQETLEAFLMQLNEEFDSPPIDMEDAEEMGARSSLTVATIASDRPSRSAQTTATISTMNEITYDGADKETIASLSDPVVVERADLESVRDEADRADNVEEELSELRAELGAFSDAQDILSEIDEATVEELAEADEPVVIEAGEFETQEKVVEQAAGIYAEELANHSPFSAEELSDRWDPAELRDKVEDHDEAELSASIETEEPAPSGGSASTEELSGVDEDSRTAEMEESAARSFVAEELEKFGWDKQAEKVREGDIPVDAFDIAIEAE